MSTYSKSICGDPAGTDPQNLSHLQEKKLAGKPFAATFLPLAALRHIAVTSTTCSDH